MTDFIRSRFEALRASIADRLDVALLDDGLEYASHREWGLALEVLADRLHEHGVAITGAEHAIIEELRRSMCIPQERLAFLDALVAAPLPSSCFMAAGRSSRSTAR